MLRASRMLSCLNTTISSSRLSSSGRKYACTHHQTPDPSKRSYHGVPRAGAQLCYKNDTPSRYDTVTNGVDKVHVLEGRQVL